MFALCGCKPGDFFFCSLPQNSGQESPATPAGRDNISILPLEWLSGKLKNLATFKPHACFQRYQSLF
jgi:hypothetical protein